MTDVRSELRELRRLVEALARWGTVASVDTGAGTVTVEYPDLPDSEPMPWALTSAAFYAEPTVGDQALVIMPSGDPLSAIAVVGVSSTDAAQGNKTGAARADLVEAELDKIRNAIINSATNPTPDGGAQYKSNMSTFLQTTPNDRGDVDASKVRVD